MNSRVWAGLAGAVGALTAEIAAAQCPPEWSAAATTGPSIRAYPNIAYEASASRVLLYGGGRGSTFYRDTWQWNGGNWSLLDSGAAGGPGVREAAAFAFDSQRSRVVLFGGAGVQTSDTWEWSGSAWTQVSTIGPPPRGFTALCYDSLRHNCVLLGGWVSGFDYLNDTWTWDGSQWTPSQRDGDMPAVRGFHAMAFDASRGVAVLYGGRLNTMSSSTFYEDTWEWDGTGWAQRFPAHSPGPRAYHTLTYDPIGRRVLLFGGFDFSSSYFNDVWEWTGDDWRELPYGATAPLGRQAHGAAFDEARGELVIFGGARGGAYRNDTWTAILPAGPRLIEQPLDATRCAGETAIFSVNATGSEPIAYRWQWDDPTIAGDGPWIDLSDGPSGSGSTRVGATASTLTIWNASAADASEYRCVVTNPCDSAASESARLQLCPGCTGDLNGDQSVDLTDLATLLSNYGMSSGAAQNDGDIDVDGDVDLSDLATLLAAFGTDC